MTKLQTSITVNPLTLKWVNSIRSFFEYQIGARLSMDQIVFIMVQHFDWSIAKELNSTSKSFEEYSNDRMEVFMNQFSKEDQDAIKNMILTCRDDETETVYSLLDLKKKKVKPKT